MADVDTKTNRVQVASLPPADSGRGIARLPDALMQSLGLAEGDLVAITGKRKTPARAIRAYNEDQGLDIIRMDGLIRILSCRWATVDTVTPARPRGASLRDDRELSAELPLILFTGTSHPMVALNTSLKGMFLSLAFRRARAVPQAAITICRSSPSTMNIKVN